MSKFQDDTTLAISEMAKICRVSRQTLIYYDNNNIFKPSYIDNNGYRFYSVYQIPFLREICALKDKNFTLKDIVDNVNGRKINDTIALLKLYQNNIDKKILTLEQKKHDINERILFYNNIEKELLRINQPFIKKISDRKILFFEWGTEKMSRKQLHITHMDLRNAASDYNVNVDFGWGSRIIYKSLKSNMPLKNSGGYILLPNDFINNFNIPDKNIIKVKGGFFACMNVYSMPYDIDEIDNLNSWILSNNFSITGDIMNECLLDTTFYTSEHKTDFCQLQVPIRIPGFANIDENI